MNLPKPRFGLPCNGCGQCCQRATCPLGAITLRRSLAGPCPALLKEGEGFACGLVKDPRRFIRIPVSVKVWRRAVLPLLGAGLGCDLADDDMPEALHDAIKNEMISALMQQVSPLELRHAQSLVYRARPR